MQGLSNVLTRALVTLNNTLSISYGPLPRPLAAGPKRNTKNMKSLLTVVEILKTFLSLSLGFSFNKPSNNSKQSGVARVTTSDNS